MTENKYDNGQTFFDLVICDFDSALFRAAQSVEETYITVKSKRTGEELTFSNQTEFFGRKKKSIEGELGKWSEFLGIAVEREDFEITKHVKIKDEFANDALDQAFREFNRQVGRIKNANLADDYRLIIGGKGNFRYDVAKINPYKHLRGEKPLVFSDLREKVIAQYGDRVLVHDGVEGDDVCGWYATENQQHFNKTGKWKLILGFIDKDIRQCYGPMVNLDNLKNGITYITPDDAVDFYCKQICKGDFSCDGIVGLPDLHPDTRAMYGIRNGTGCGDVAAEKIIEGAKTPLEKFIRVADAYKKYYGAETVHELSGGEKYIWKDFLRENALLLRMMKTPTERYDIIDFLENKMKVDLDSLNLVLEINPETKEKKIVNNPLEV